MRKPIVIGHRGAPKEAPENTLRSFQRALELGADMVELDAQETADGYLICMHDYDVSRTTNGEGMVEELTLDEIRSFDAGDGARVPLVSEVLDLARGKMGVNIELKIPGTENKVLALVKERKMIDSILISSFIHESIKDIRELDANIPTAILFNQPMDDLIAYSLDIGANAINPLFNAVDEDMVKSAKDANLNVFPWTVNDQEIMKDFLQFGVDGLITDLPTLAMVVIKEFLSNLS